MTAKKLESYTHPVQLGRDETELTRQERVTAVKTSSHSHCVLNHNTKAYCYTRRFSIQTLLHML